jgi:20S proteasome alpha/beta subunit
VYIASDLQITCDNFKQDYAVKILEIQKNFYIGYCGSTLIRDILQLIKYNQIAIDVSNKLKLPDEIFLSQFMQNLRQFSMDKRYTIEEDSKPYLDSQFIIVYNKNIYSTCSSGSITKHLKYHAIGSGSPYALGSIRTMENSQLKSFDILGTAMGVCNYFDSNTGLDFEIIKI